MAPFRLVSLFGILLTPLASAHFMVNTPPPLGDNINNEGVAPCGGFTPSSSSTVTDFHVAGDAIGLTTLHEQSYFAYRGMLGTSLTSPNWTILIPTVEEFGLNNFCEPSVPAPASWAGSTGLLQIIQDSEDGIHYQCMAVKFVSGMGTPPSSCSNSSGVSAQYGADPTLSSAEGIASSNSSSTAAPTASSTAASKSAALPMIRSGVAGRGLLAGIFAVFFTL